MAIHFNPARPLDLSDDDTAWLADADMGEGDEY